MPLSHPFAVTPLADLLLSFSAGSKFWYANNPQVMVRVRNAGEVGVTQITEYDLHSS